MIQVAGYKELFRSLWHIENLDIGNLHIYRLAQRNVFIFSHERLRCEYTYKKHLYALHRQYLDHPWTSLFTFSGFTH